MNETLDLFLPVITDDISGDDKRALRRDLANKIDQALHREDCAKAISPYKCNGMVHGHKVLDNEAALLALIAVAPKDIAESISKSPLMKYEKIQVLDQVLRKAFAIDKHGKIDGTLSKTAQKRLEKREAAGM